MTENRSRSGKLCMVLLAGHVPSAAMAFCCFLVLVLAPLDGVVEPRLLLALRILSGSAFVSIAAFGIWAAIAFVGPSQRVAQRARALADGDLTTPVPRRGRDDEIDWIADSIAATAAAMRELQTSRAVLHDEIRRLESRVLERTAKLADAERRFEAALADVEAFRGELVRHERLAALGAMVAGFAHELNTPIGNALTSASVLAREVRTLRAAETADPAVVADRLQRVSELLERSLGRAAEMITTLKQVSADQASAQRRTFHLHDAVRALYDTVAPTLLRASVRLRVTVPADIRLDSYPGPLEQALYNLVHNAEVHAFDGRPGGAVEIRAEQDGGLVRIVVEDDGAGIPPDALPFVFDPFFTTKIGRGGTGLGLHMVQSTVTTLLGGRVTLDSGPGRGTRIVLEIPTSAPIERASEVVQPAPTSKVTPWASGRSRP